MSYGRLLSKNVELCPLQEARDACLIIVNEQGIMTLNREMLYAGRVSYLGLLVEAADVLNQ